MFADLPDERGYFGEFGGRFAPEVLMQYLIDLDVAYSRYKGHDGFQNELKQLLEAHAKRETPLYLAENLSRHAGGASIYLKREDLTSTGSHHINAALGQALLAREMGKTLLITETSTGLQGIAVAKVATIMDMGCQVFIGAADANRQQGCVDQMRALGARVAIVETGSGSLLDANQQTTGAWLGAIQNGFYVVNSVVGPHPYPMMVRNFQSIIGHEVKQQMLSATGRFPDHLVASIGGGSNAMGLFYPFLDTTVAMTGVEAAGDGSSPAARFQHGRPGIFQGVKTIMRQDDNGQLLNVDSLAVGLQTCLVGPEPSFLHASGRVSCEAVSDEQALAAYQLSRELESITPALESAHAIAWGLELAASLNSDNNIVINLSGQGEKDAGQIPEAYR
jgi:tryptophan synthase beta chain